MADFADIAELRGAGGIIWSPPEEGPRRIVVVHRRKRADWALPKGKPEPDEKPIETALREAMEETGYVLRLECYAGQYRYLVKGRLKIVDMWHMTRLPGEYANRAPLNEIDDVVWMTPAEAVQRLTHPVEREFVATHAGDFA